MSTTFMAGVARVTITPPVGSPMAGFAGRAVSTSVHDDLTATALVIQGVGPMGRPVRIAMVCCDLISLDTPEVDRIKAAIVRLTGIPTAHVLLACAHNHYGPVTNAEGRGLTASTGPQLGPYVENLIHTVAGAVAMAAGDLAECRLLYGQATATIGVNRREHTSTGDVILGANPDGPADHTVRMLRVEKQTGEPLAAVLNYACHVVSLNSGCNHFTADFPGVARRVVESQTGATCLFVQGAAGDVNPILIGDDWTHLERLGVPLGAAATAAYVDAESIASAVPVDIATATLSLPPLLPESVTLAVERLSRLEKRGLAPNCGPAEPYWHEVKVSRLKRGIAVLQGDAPLVPVTAEITAVALGPDVAVTTAPGEIFNEIGERILDRSPFRHTLYSGYTNGSIDYVPTRAAYSEGGFEVAYACHVAPEAGEQIQKRSVALLDCVYDAVTVTKS